MKEIKSDLSYQPVSCDLHSQYELAIMHKNMLCLTWRKDGEVVTETKIIPVDVTTENKAEYLVVRKASENDVFLIRLDYIIEMNISSE